MKFKNKVIDLFCGAGGLSLGFEMAGFDVVASVDKNPHAVATHKHNFKGLSTCEDLLEVDAEHFLDKYQINKDEIAGIIGGPPCQGFSMAGKRMIDDPRNRLFLEFVRFVEYVKPNFFLIENVPGLLSMDKGKVKDEILEIFSNFGYNVSYSILNSADFGVAQARKRVFFLGVLNCESSLPKPVLSPNQYVSVQQVIGNLPPLSSGEGGEVVEYNGNTYYNHYAFPVRDLNDRRIKAIPEGGGYKDLPEELHRAVPYTSSYQKLHRDKPSSTITCHFRDSYLSHPTQNRVITVREAARIQSFPDDFVFIGPRSREGQCGLVGNAVPPLLAKAIAEHILTFNIL